MFLWTRLLKRCSRWWLRQTFQWKYAFLSDSQAPRWLFSSVNYQTTLLWQFTGKNYAKKGFHWLFFGSFLRSLSRSPLTKQVCPRTRISCLHALLFLLSYVPSSLKQFFAYFLFHGEAAKGTSLLQECKINVSKIECTMNRPFCWLQMKFILW